MTQDTGKFRENLKDKFYTAPHIAKHCIQQIITLRPSSVNSLWIEPSAGNGSFLQVPSPITCMAMDIEPESKEIHRQDYLKWIPNKTEQQRVVFGNPPFGRQSSLAKAFIRKSCTFASLIAFILPKSFTKPSMYHAFDPLFHLIHCEDLPTNSFLLNGEPYDVPCIFQIWEKQEEVRQKVEKVEAIGFEYVKVTDRYDFACRRVGVFAGKCYPSREAGYSVQSHYFIRLANPLNTEDIRNTIDRMTNHIFPSNTIGPRSLSKSEINQVLNQLIS